MYLAFMLIKISKEFSWKVFFQVQQLNYFVQVLSIHSKQDPNPCFCKIISELLNPKRERIAMTVWFWYFKRLGLCYWLLLFRSHWIQHFLLLNEWKLNILWVQKVGYLNNHNFFLALIQWLCLNIICNNAQFAIHGFSFH